MRNLLTAVRSPSRALGAVATKLGEERAARRMSHVDRDRELADRSSTLAQLLGLPCETLARYEAEMRDDRTFRTEFVRRLAEVVSSEGGTASTADAETMYLICRAIRPRIVVETGVQFGSFDAHILNALAGNEIGTLHSIDLPKPKNPYPQGHLIPEELRDRWQLHLGDARTVLPDLLSRIGPLDLFLHDSHHTARHMRWEYETALPHMRSGGVVASHDVLCNGAFENFSRRHGLRWCRVLGTGLAVVAGSADRGADRSSTVGRDQAGLDRP